MTTINSMRSMELTQLGVVKIQEKKKTELTKRKSQLEYQFKSPGGWLPKTSQVHCHYNKLKMTERTLRISTHNTFSKLINICSSSYCPPKILMRVYSYLYCVWVCVMFENTLVSQLGMGFQPYAISNVLAGEFVPGTVGPAAWIAM